MGPAPHGSRRAAPGTERSTPCHGDTPQGHARPDAGRSEAVRSDTGRPDAVRPDAVRPDAVRPEAARSDAGWSEAGRPDAVRFGAVRFGAVRPEAGRPGAGRSVRCRVRPLPRDRRRRLHRRPARPRAARRRPPRALPGPHPRQPPRLPLGRPGRDRQGRRHRRGDPEARVRGRGGGLLPRALPRLRARLRGDGPARGPDLRRGGPRRRRPPHRLPGRPHTTGRARGGTLPAPALPRRGRPHPARLRRPHDRAAGRRRHRLRLRLLRDAPLPHRAAPRDADAELGQDPRPAHRRARRAALPRRQRGHAPGRQPGLRRRRPGRPHLPRHDDRVRGRRRPAQAPHRVRADAYPGPVQPLDRPGHARPGRPGPAARGVAAVRSGLRRARHRGVRPRPARHPDPLRPRLTLALRRIQEAKVTTRWSSASLPGAPSDPLPTDPDWAGGSLYTDERERTVDAPPETLWKVVEGIGGENGWYSFPLAWAVRGWLDRLVGGVGLRRGRRDAQRLRVGDALDFWRVEEIERAACSGCARRCGSPGSPGWRCAPNATSRGGPATASAPCSIRADSPGRCTGGAWRRSTRSSSAAWRATSPARRNGRRPTGPCRRRARTGRPPAPATYRPTRGGTAPRVRSVRGGLPERDGPSGARRSARSAPASVCLPRAEKGRHGRHAATGPHHSRSPPGVLPRGRRPVAEPQNQAP